MTERYETEFGTFTWHPEPRNCPHQNGHACPTCDFDSYYRGHIPCSHAWWEDPL